MKKLLLIHAVYIIFSFLCLKAAIWSVIEINVSTIDCVVVFALWGGLMIIPTYIKNREVSKHIYGRKKQFRKSKA